MRLVCLVVGLVLFVLVGVLLHSDIVVVIGFLKCMIFLLCMGRCY